MRVTTVNYSYCVTNCGVVDGGYRERKFFLRGDTVWCDGSQMDMAAIRPAVRVMIQETNFVKQRGHASIGSPAKS